MILSTILLLVCGLSATKPLAPVSGEMVLWDGSRSAEDEPTWRLSLQVPDGGAYGPFDALQDAKTCYGWVKDQPYAFGPQNDRLVVVSVAADQRLGAGVLTAYGGGA